jgi:hypothetical protein
MVDPLNPIGPGAAAPPSRRVPPVDRLRKITRDGDRPEREAPGREEGEERDDGGAYGGDGRERRDDDGRGHVDVRV